MQATCCGHRAELDRVYAALAAVTTTAADADAADGRSLYYAGQVETARTAAEWAEFDAALTARAKALVGRRWTPAQLAAEDRDQHRIDDAQLLRDYPHYRKDQP